MSRSGAYIAIDWGTTNRRAYLMGDDGTVIDTHADDRGILLLGAEDYPREIELVRERWGSVPVIVAGMAGSSRGWLDVPYVRTPADANDVGRDMVAAPVADVLIVPGVAEATEARRDVMRGEEVQVFGAIEAGFAPADALFCQPGTHNKWIRTHAGRIEYFATVMTGELFSLLRANGILSGMLDGAVSDTAVFRSGVEHGAATRSLGAALFEVRASVVLGNLAPRDAAAYASGVLIGNDIATCENLASQDIHLLGADGLAELYRSGIELLGGTVVPIDSHAAFVAGIHLLRGLRR